MGKIFSPPDEVGKLPEFSDYGDDFRAYMNAQEEYVKKVQAFAVANRSGKYVGKEVSFPHADGYARYVIFSIKPLILLHLAVGDAWQYPHVERLTAKDVQQAVDRQEGLSKLFGSERAPWEPLSAVGG